MQNFFRNLNQTGQLADVQFTKLEFDNPFALAGKNTDAQFDLYNSSSVIVTDINVRVYLTYTRNPKVPISPALYNFPYSALAPGERKQVKFTIPLPDSLHFQDYSLYATLENRTEVAERQFERTDATSTNQLLITSIIPLSPFNGAKISELPDAILSWDAPKLNNFFDRNFNRQDLCRSEMDRANSFKSVI